MISKKLAILALVSIMAPSFANAISVDLSGWSSEGGSSNWAVQPGNDTVLQSVNGAPTVFFDSSAVSTQGTALNGKISVTNGGNWDNDFIGFVLGYNQGEIFSSTADYYLVDWKQGDQAGWGEGLSISHVTNGSGGNTTSTSGSFWQHTADEVDLITRATNLGDTGWVDETEYAFNIIFTSSLIEIKVDGFTELSITPSDVAGVSSFTDGSFGFYNYSQEDVLYSSITQVSCERTPDAPECQTSNDVPEPITIALMGLGLAGIGFTRKRRVKI
jgi:hypothetical protein